MNEQRPTRSSDLRLGDLDELLSEALPDLDVLDLDLRLGTDLFARVVAADGRGRLVLVLLPEAGEAPEAEERPLELDVLDALAFARRELPQLARHVAPSRLRGDLEPLVVVVAAAFAPRAVERLAPLLEGAARLFELRTLETRSARAAYLVPVAVPSRPDPESRRDPQAFVAGLEGGRAELARTVLRRLARIDDAIECRATGEGLDWHYRGALLAALGDSREHLEAVVPGNARARAVAGPGDVEDLLDACLARYVELLGAAGEGGEELEQIEIVPAEAGALLTPEEIEAFRG